MTLSTINQVEEMSFEQLQTMQNQILGVQMKKLADELEKVRDEQRRLEMKYEIESQRTKDSITRIEQLAQSNLRAKQPKYGWVTLREFGSMFETTLSNHRVGKLLRAAGLAIKGKSRTVPYRRNMGDGRYCQVNVHDGRSTYVWNYGRCMVVIDSWLEKIGEYAQFYALVASKNEKAFAEYIDRLHDRYGAYDCDVGFR